MTEPEELAIARKTLVDAITERQADMDRLYLGLDVGPVEMREFSTADGKHRCLCRSIIGSISRPDGTFPTGWIEPCRYSDLKTEREVRDATGYAMIAKVLVGSAVRHAEADSFKPGGAA